MLKKMALTMLLVSSPSLCLPVPCSVPLVQGSGVEPSCVDTSFDVMTTTLASMKPPLLVPIAKSRIRNLHAAVYMEANNAPNAPDRTSANDKGGGGGGASPVSSGSSDCVIIETRKPSPAAKGTNAPPSLGTPSGGHSHGNSSDAVQGTSAAKANVLCTETGKGVIVEGATGGTSTGEAIVGVKRPSPASPSRPREVEVLDLSGSGDSGATAEVVTVTKVETPIQPHASERNSDPEPSSAKNTTVRASAWHMFLGV